LSDFDDESQKTDIVATPLRLLEETTPRVNSTRYTVCERFAYGGLPNAHVAFVEGAAGFRRRVVVQHLQRQPGREPSATPGLSPDALLGCHVRHPNVLPVLDLIQSKGEWLLVIEYVVSATLEQLLDQGNRLPIPISGGLASGLLHAVQAAHTAVDSFDTPLEVVHAGIAPDNVLVGVDGTARLVNFGSAKSSLLGDTASHSAGRSGYHAPEQVFDRRADARADIFATGVVLWECLTGRRLLEGASPVDSMLRFMSRPVIKPSQVNARVTPALDAVLVRALEPTPERRFQSAAEFARALEAAVRPATRNEIARYVEGVAFATLHEQKALLKDSVAPPDDKVQISMLVDRTQRRAEQSSTRASVRPERPPASHSRASASDLIDADIDSDWVSRQPEEPTKVERAPSPAPILGLPSDEDETQLYLSPPPTPRLAIPETQHPASAPAAARRNRAKQSRTARGWLLSLLLLTSALAACSAFAILRPQAARLLQQRAAATAESARQGLTRIGQRLARGRDPAPTRAVSAAPRAQAPRAAPQVPRPAATPPEGAATPELRVLSIDELPLVDAGSPAQKSSKRRPRPSPHPAPGASE
jgi:serine/threonine-protein kinase